MDKIIGLGNALVDVLATLDSDEILAEMELPKGSMTLIDEDKLLSIIDQMRVSIPEDIKKGQQILAQRDRIIAQGQEEANRTLQIAREKANQLLEKDAIIQSAQNRAGQIIEQAKLDSEVNKFEADEYIIKSLTDLEAQLVVLLNQVKNGIQALSNTTQVIQPETEEEGQ